MTRGVHVTCGEEVRGWDRHTGRRAEVSHTAATADLEEFWRGSACGPDGVEEVVEDVVAKRVVGRRAAAGPDLVVLHVREAGELAGHAAGHGGAVRARVCLHGREGRGRAEVDHDVGRCGAIRVRLEARVVAGRGLLCGGGGRVVRRGDDAVRDG